MASQCSIDVNNTNYIKNMWRNINSNRNTTCSSLSIFKVITFVSLTNSISLCFLFTAFTLFLLCSFILRLNSFTTNNIRKGFRIDYVKSDGKKGFYIVRENYIDDAGEMRKLIEKQVCLNGKVEES